MIQKLEQAIGHHFKSQSLLMTALTHRSYSSQHYERLEFLGDSILDAVIAKVLYERFPDVPEGDLSRLRANLVKQDSLHKIAESISLGQYLRLGEGELKSGGGKRPSILADSLEALLGAIWMDAGYDAVNNTIVLLYKEMIDGIASSGPIKDAKTRLQEYLQGRHLSLPKYQLLTVEGEAHAQRFTITCEIEPLKIKTTGTGTNRRTAEQMAAELALGSLK